MIIKIYNQYQNNIEFKNEFEDKKIMANKNEEIKEKDKKLKNNQNIFKIDNQLFYQINH